MKIRSLVMVLGLVAVCIGSSLPAQGQEALRQIQEDVAAWQAQVEQRGAALARVSVTAQEAPAGQDAATIVNPVCLPTCSGTDARFLSVAGEDLQTLARDAIQLRVAVPAGETSFMLGFFDGDTGGFWDLSGPTAVPLRYTLIADPLGDGTGIQVVAMWLGSDLADNDWSDFAVATGPEAESPSGSYFYRLLAESTDPVATNNWSNFKVRTSGTISTSASVAPVAFAFTAPLFSGNEGFIIYPNAGMGDFVTTTYDGTWTFFVDVFRPVTDFVAWDGDFDFGAWDNSTMDTDDPDTPGAPFLPPWAIATSARPEGVAFVLTCGSEPSQTGCPADDRSPGIFQRSPSVMYSVTTPGGELFSNPNPSGNREWEQFRLSTEPFDPSQMDFHVDDLGPGIYEVKLDGVDLSNLNAWRFFDDVLGVCEDGTPCAPRLRPFLVGDTVFFDLDGDGVQEDGETGIEGVELILLAEDGSVLGTTTTDAGGFYTFDVYSGTYSVRLADSNFEPGGALEGLAVTTGGSDGGREQTDTVLVDNVLTYDFGVRGTSALGDRVWNDLDGDGLQEPGEPGIEGVTIRLLDEDGNLIATTVTGADGEYLFEGLVGGTYTVEIDVSTLPAGFEPTFDSDGLATPNRATIFLPPQTETLTVDFGYDGCGECEGKVTRLTLRYDGVLPAEVEVIARRGPSTDPVFSGTLQPGDSFEVVGPQSGNGGFFGTLGTEIRLFVDGDLNAELHTSCSQPIGPGTVGGDFTVLAGASRHGGPLCPAGGDTGEGDDEEDDESLPGTGTIGYWKNHPGAWPVSSLRLGDSQVSKQEALEILHTSPRGDESIILLHQLIAAKLNVAAGSEGHCVEDTIEDADDWLEDHGSDVLPSYRMVVDYGRKGRGGRGGHDADDEAEELAERLDEYNNGRLCAPHRGGERELEV